MTILILAKVFEMSEFWDVSKCGSKKLRHYLVRNAILRALIATATIQKLNFVALTSHKKPIKIVF